MTVLEWFLAALVLCGALPQVSGCYQYALASVHRFRRRPTPVGASFPRVAIIVPAWNEEAVIGRTLDQLAALEYPAGHLRVYVVDDASTDATPDRVRAKAAQYPGLVFHLRREKGGEGKAHTINHGLTIIREEGWYEAVMVIDADVILTPPALRRMTRHLLDPDVGAVTAYIKEGSRPGNTVNRFIAFEYITAQGAARRAQNVLGAQACLAGGAQLIRRSSFEAIGGRIDTSTLAEDTVTTFKVQMAGGAVVFDPHAIVWAEEPRDLGGLWRQRVRWARGNVQVTSAFRGIWFNRARGGPLGGIGFAFIWFSIFLMPLLMVLSTAGLLGLFFIDEDTSVHVFRTLWFLTLLTYLFITLSSFSMDPETAKRCWVQGVCFPGLVSLAIIAYASFPSLLDDLLVPALHDLGISTTGALPTVALIFVYVWPTACMGFAWLNCRLERVRGLRWAAMPMLYLVGYGPLLCAITTAGYLKELRGADMVWEKTEKTGHIGAELTP